MRDLNRRGVVLEFVEAGGSGNFISSFHTAYSSGHSAMSAQCPVCPKADSGDMRPEHRVASARGVQRLGCVQCGAWRVFAAELVKRFCWCAAVNKHQQHSELEPDERFEQEEC